MQLPRKSAMSQWSEQIGIVIKYCFLQMIYDLCMCKIDESRWFTFLYNLHGALVFVVTPGRPHAGDEVPTSGK